MNPDIAIWLAMIMMYVYHCWFNMQLYIYNVVEVSQVQISSLIIIMLKNQPIINSLALVCLLFQVSILYSSLQVARYIVDGFKLAVS